MACQICGRNSCTRSFHSLEDQERFDEKQTMSSDVDDLRDEILNLKEEISNLKNSIQKSTNTSESLSNVFDDSKFLEETKKTIGGFYKRIKKMK